MMNFEENKKYRFGFISDSSIEVVITVIKRTPKTITFFIEGEKEIKRKVFSDENGEYVFPYGKYSMSPVCRAKNKIK